MHGKGGEVRLLYKSTCYTNCEDESL